ncbi:nuclear lim interactor-interacting factor [Angomonas deanei]|nr:nuclear lim interactor-interacting factor [Angomonas deanei]|eukprot:EPY38474.1 nuclear lim interactor-interacting factor [Angomonas deanei]
MPFSQKIRGASFRDEYIANSDDFMVADTNDAFLIPPKSPMLGDCLTVVLDLDETLIYGRENALYVRPHIQELLEFLAAHCETVVWTRAVHHYADAVIHQIDAAKAVDHLICRHPTWCTHTNVKDLHLLGRDLDSIIIFENTPDCIRGFEGNGVLVEDYTGGELEDTTLLSVLHLLREVVDTRRRYPSLSISECLARAQLAQKQHVPTRRGG